MFPTGQRAAWPFRMRPRLEAIERASERLVKAVFSAALSLATAP
jgi:hypothetical protein